MKKPFPEEETGSSLIQMLYEIGKSALGDSGSFFLLSSRIPCAATRSHRALFVGGGRSPRTRRRHKAAACHMRGLLKVACLASPHGWRPESSD